MSTLKTGNITHPSSTGTAITLDASDNVTFDTDTLVVDAANNRVGVGTASPDVLLHINGANPEYRIEDNNETGSGNIVFRDSARETAKISVSSGASATMQFQTLGTEAMRLDASQNLLVGTTSTTPWTNSAGTSADNAIALREDGLIAASRYAGNAAFFNRTSNDGAIVVCNKNGSSVGTLGYISTGFYIDGETNHSGWRFGNGGIIPFRNGADSDNITDLGSSSSRMDDIFATNGTIQTSDQNEKQDIEELSEAEKRVATAAKGLIRKFRWIDAVAKKGDDARIHVGVIAQDLQAAFEAEGLDAGRYAMFISSTWWEADEVIPAVAEELDEDGNVITEAQPERTEKRTYETAEEAPEGAVERTRLGVRYPELLAFIIGAL